MKYVVDAEVSLSVDNLEVEINFNEDFDEALRKAVVAKLNRTLKVNSGSAYPNNITCEEVTNWNRED